jgi:hypothetical protein
LVVDLEGEGEGEDEEKEMKMKVGEAESVGHVMWRLMSQIDEDEAAMRD